MFILLFFFFIMFLALGQVIFPFVIYFYLAPIIGNTLAGILSILFVLFYLPFCQGGFGGHLDKLAHWCKEHS